MEIKTIRPIDFIGWLNTLLEKQTPEVLNQDLIKQIKSELNFVEKSSDIKILDYKTEKSPKGGWQGVYTVEIIDQMYSD